MQGLLSKLASPTGFGVDEIVRVCARTGKTTQAVRLSLLHAAVVPRVLSSDLQQEV